MSTAYASSNPYDSPSVSEGATSIPQQGSELKGNWNLKSFHVLFQDGLVDDQDLPPIPEPSIIAQILDLYFAKASYILSVIQAPKFQRNLNDLLDQMNPKGATIPNVGASPYAWIHSGRSISPALVLSMLAIGSDYHTSYSTVEGKEYAKKAFYERARRLVLQEPEKMNLTVLKTTIHLAYYGVSNNMWTQAYFWHGYNITCCRFMKIPNLDPAGSIRKNEDQLIADEETRRCFWNVRQSDISSAAASKKLHYFQSPDEYFSLLLPQGHYIFNTCSPSNYPSTISLSQFFDPSFPAAMNQSLDPVAYVSCLQYIFGRVTDIRRESESKKIACSDASSPFHSTYIHIVHDLELFFSKLPEGVKQMDREIFPPDWNHEMGMWINLLICYHATFICLHGPEYNMMSMGRELFDDGSNFGTLQRFVRHTSTLESILSKWENSISFVQGLQHANTATSLIREKIQRQKLVNLDNADTPFFSYCCCQIGLINLIAVRQLILIRNRKADEISLGLKEKVSIVIELLNHHAEFFGGSAVGVKLLSTILIELDSGRISIEVLNQSEKMGHAVNSENLLVQKLLSAGISQTTCEVLNEPGKCAGTFMTS